MTDPRPPEPPSAVDLSAAERQIEEQRRLHERSIAEAEEQLRRLDERTKVAEERLRAAEASQLEELRAEEEALRARLEEMQGKVAKAEEHARETERRANEAERSLAGAIAGADAPAPPPSAPPAPSSATAPEPPDSVVDLNKVDFDQLRRQDFTVAQATRLLAHRERQGGFRSVDDLDHLEGFSYEAIVDLKGRSSV
jgi:DNA uptake protein ComE-like DNA-binding protein